MKTGIEIIAAERARQIAQEHWSEKHDDSHHRGEMAQAAACYALQASDRRGKDQGNRTVCGKLAHDEYFKRLESERITRERVSGSLLFHHAFKVLVIKQALRVGDSLIKFRYALLILGFLGCLILAKRTIEPMPAASEQQSTKREAGTFPVSTSANAQNDTAKGNNNTAPSRDALDYFKAFFGHRYFLLIVTPLSLVSAFYSLERLKREHDLK